MLPNNSEAWGDVTDTYTAQWQEYRRRRRWAFAVALGIGPLAALLLGIDGHPWLEPVAAVLGLAWIGAAAVTGWRFGLWPCPRCGHPFCVTSLRDWFWSLAGDRLRALLTSRCLHCGLPKWASSETGH
ncbi:MAG: hypothetical protein GEU99_12125 [Luteitalea sp.]|nr:hypothetical protein [Luteitalea sp.]